VTGLTRRGFLRQTASAAPIVAVGSIATAGASLAYAGSSPIADVVNEALARAGELRQQAAKVIAACRAADAALPTWAAPGPSMLRADGTLEAPDVGWPLDESIPPPTLGYAFRRVRQGPGDIREGFDQMVAAWCWGDYDWTAARRAQFRAIYRKRMRRFIELRRAQLAEEAKVGLPELNKRAEALVHAMNVAENEIRGLPDEPAEASIVAAKVLVTLQDDCFGGDLLTSPSLRNQMNTLRILRPQLTGPVASYADELLTAAPGTKFADISFGALLLSDGAA
jgi:hypothetical protein